jgi:hypothetical protein
MRFFVTSLPLTLVACEPGSPERAGNDIAPVEPSVVGSAQSAAGGQAMAEEQVKAAERGSGRGAWPAAAEGAPPPGAFIWTGRYAATQALCEQGIWEFTNARVKTAGETVCAINDAAEGGGRVELRLSCAAEGMKSEEKWTLTRTSAEGMKVSRSIKEQQESIDANLVRCG